jgi:hypothetical protein
MNPEELELRTGIAWDTLGRGSFNKALISKIPFSLEGSPAWYWVIKQPIEPTDTACHSRRMVEKWTAINPDFPAYEIPGTDNQWIAPYLGDIPAPDDLREAEVLRIYLTTRNIITDAIVENNFLSVSTPTPDDPTACKAVCIDLDCSWRPRRGSIVSDSDIWDWRGIEASLEASHRKYPLTTSLLRTLIYIERHLKPEEIKNTYITPSMMRKVRYLRLDKIPLTADMMEALLSFSQENVRRFVHLFKDLNTDSSPLTPDEIKNLLKIIKLDTANEIPLRHLRNFLLSDPLTHHNAIHLAAELGLLELTKQLLSQNRELSKVTNRYKVSALHRALERRDSLHNRGLIIQYLLMNGADINLQVECEHHLSNGFTPLDVARRQDQPEEIQAILIDWGAFTCEELSATTARSSGEESPAAPPPSTTTSGTSPSPTEALASLGVFGGASRSPAAPAPTTRRPRALTV